MNSTVSFMTLISEISFLFFKKKTNKTKEEMLSFNVLIPKTSLLYGGELSVANHNLTRRDGMFVCLQGILLNRLSELLRKMGKY